MAGEPLRNWGPVVGVLAALPFVFLAINRCADRPESAGSATRAGSEGCAECHPAQFAAWSSSNHARAEGDVPADLVWNVRLGDAPAPRPVRTLGVDPLVQFLVPFEGGRLQVTQDAWDPKKREWFDVFADGRQPGEWGHWTGGGMTWNSQCATCHSTSVVQGWDAAAQVYQTSVAEHRVGCAACHGDAVGHPAGGTVVRPDLDECASCHARRSELTVQFRPGEAFLDHFAPHLVDDTDAFWPDGQVREEDFEWTAFVGSQMHESGVTCTSCHDPHSGQLVPSVSGPVCTNCHAGTKDHDPHPDGAAVDCLGCHMPVTTYMQRDPRHDHGFAIPDVAVQVQLGIPDPCTRCHTYRDGAWAARTAEAWWPPPDPARRARIVAVARGRERDPSAVNGLLSTLRGDRPAFRAAAAAVLGAYLPRDEVRAALLAGTSDGSELVRFAATGALAGAASDPQIAAALEQRLADPVRAVRVQAARAMRGRLDPTDPRVAEYVTYLDLQADTPSGLHERATWRLERGQVGAAVNDLRAAVAQDPRSPALREALAVGLSRLGDGGGAAMHLREAVKFAPDDAGLWFRLGLAEAGVHDLAGARVALERAAELDQTDARTWYNLGLVRQQLADPRALDALRQAQRLSPQDPDPAYAVASALWNAGHRADAREAAKRVLMLAPDHAGARQILTAP